ncbi:hypothetical protein RFI_08500, partial [Reticulomyxa filosa]
DVATLSRNFITGLPNNNAFLQTCETIFNEHKHNTSMQDKHGSKSPDLSSSNSPVAPGRSRIRSGTNDSGTSDSTLHDDVFGIDDPDMAKHTKELDPLGLLPDADDAHEWGLLLMSIDDFQDATDQLGGISVRDQFLQHVSGLLHSKISNENQKLFHLDLDLFALVLPVESSEQLLAVSGAIISHLQQSAITLDLDKNRLSKLTLSGSASDKESQTTMLVPPTTTEEIKTRSHSKTRSYRLVWDGPTNTAKVWLTISIGISLLRKQSDTLDKGDNSQQQQQQQQQYDRSPADWIQKADLSLQRARSKGKNCVGPLYVFNVFPICLSLALYTCHMTLSKFLLYIMFRIDQLMSESDFKHVSAKSIQMTHFMFYMSMSLILCVMCVCVCTRYLTSFSLFSFLFSSMNW